jgi:hypothetical protein
MLKPVPGRPGEFVDDETGKVVKIVDSREATVEERDRLLRWYAKERRRKEKLPN